MVYPASAKAFRIWIGEVDQQCILLKESAILQMATSQAGNLDMDSVRRFFDLLIQSNVFFMSAAAVPGISTYIRDEKSSGELDVSSELISIMNTVVSLLNWIRTATPESGFGGTQYKLAFFFPANNITQITSLRFTALQTQEYRVRLTELISKIG